MDSLITIFRIPIGFVATLVLLVILLPVEFIMWVICAPLGAIVLSRYSFKMTWLATFPNTLTVVGLIWEWVQDEY
jgi:hypothetical protein